MGFMESVRKPSAKAAPQSAAPSRKYLLWGLPLAFIAFVAIIISITPAPKTVSLKALKALAANGDVNAEYAVGYAYYRGKGVKMDRAEALKWLRRPAEQGNADAQVKLGVAYTYGEHVQKDEAEGLKWTSKAAAQGNRHAFLNMGTAYRDGQGGIVPDNKQAAIWYKKSSDLGLPKAHYLLAMLYWDGQGVERNATEAFRLLTLAGDQGVSEAQHMLGVAYSTGYGTGYKDDRQATSLWRSAANQGHTQAQVALAGAYLQGKGIYQDNFQAYKWLKYAEANGSEYAKQILLKVEPLLTARELKRWKDSYEEAVQAAAARRE